ncbi:hypothetical protein Mapa_003807 [Marchantia paleacea]|nr:hypothetical protein Mapa_003807 [Marchantia paleacea]
MLHGVGLVNNTPKCVVTWYRHRFSISFGAADSYLERKEGRLSTEGMKVSCLQFTVGMCIPTLLTQSGVEQGLAVIGLTGLALLTD